jgi:hypothetical protein
VQHYLMIQNPGEAPIDAFLVHGLSGSKGWTGQASDRVIGKFGTGNKQATFRLLREGINPQVYCGLKQLSWFTKPAEMADELGSVNYQRVFCTINGTETIDLNTSLEHGSVDWTETSMALREYVSNALDRTMKGYGTFKHEHMKLSIVTGEEVCPYSGMTRVFIPLTPDVQRFYNEIKIWFLHFAGTVDKPLLQQKSNADGLFPIGTVYRVGVKVRETVRAVFRYNFGQELEIDESRKLNDGQVIINATKHFQKNATIEQWAELFRQLLKDFNGFESQWQEYYFDWDDKQFCFNALQGWESVACGRVLMLNLPMIDEFMRHKGIKPVLINSERWFNILRRLGAKTYYDVLTDDERQGKMTKVATHSVLEVMEEVWDNLILLGVAPNGKMPPQAKCFYKKVDAEAQAYGFYRDGVIYIHEKIADGKSTMLYETVLEELVHYITGSRDGSRDIQEFLLTLVIKSWNVKVEQ